MHRIMSKLKPIKYPLITVILGVLICASVIWFAGHIEPGYHTLRWVNQDGTFGGIVWDSQKFDLWEVIVWPGVCFLTGLSVFITAFVHAVKIHRHLKNGHSYPLFSIIHIILGAIFIGAMIWYLGWLEPPKFIKPILMPDGGYVILYRNPNWIRALLAWKICSFVLGAGVIGSGIIQLRLARRSIYAADF